VFLLFEDTSIKETLDSLHQKHPKKIGLTTLENILIELRNFGLVQKNDEFYSISKSNIEISNEGFVSFITQKFQNYTPYLVLKKMNLDSITKDDITKVLKEIFKQEYQDKTWDAYSLNLISWFLQSKLDIKSKIVEPKKGRGNKLKALVLGNNAIPRSSLKDILKVLNESKNSKILINSKNQRDLLILDIIDDKKNISNNGIELLKLDEATQIVRMKERIKTIPKILELEKQLILNPKIKLKEILNVLPSDFFEGKETSSKLVYASKAMTWLK